MAEAPALDVRHHVIDEATRLAGIDERQDVGVLELRREPDLAQEPLGAEEGGKFRAEHLDCDQAVVLQIASEIDRGHPAATELALDTVAAGQRRLEAVQQLGDQTAPETVPANIRATAAQRLE